MVGKRNAKRKADEELESEEKRVRDSTVVTPASQAKCLAPGMMGLLRTVVKEANEAVFYATSLANAHFVRCFERGLQPPVPNADFYYTCITRVTLGHMTPTVAKSEELCMEDTYAELFGRKEGLVDASNHMKIPSYVSGELATAAALYNTVGIFDHMVHYIRAKYNISTKGHANFICRRITNLDNPLNFESMPKTLTYMSREHVNEIIMEEHSHFHSAHQSGTLYRYRYDMLKVIEATTTDEFRVKTFTILPVRQMGPKFISLDKRTMDALWMRLKPPKPTKGSFKGRTKTADYEIAMARWEPTHAAWEEVSKRAKDLSSWFVWPKRGKGWERAKLIRTNGYEFHFTFDKNAGRLASGKKARVERKNKTRPEDSDPKYIFANKKDINPVIPQNFAACDVGHHNLVTTVSPTKEAHPNGSPMMEVRNYAKTRYNHETMRNKINKKAKHLSAKPSIVALNNELALNSIKSSSYEEVRRGTVARCVLWKAHYDHYSNKQFMKDKAAARMAEAKTIDKLLHWITWGGTKPLGWGDGAKTTGFKGLGPGGPLKKIRQHGVRTGYDITMVKEGCTSMRACCCRGQDLVPQYHVGEDGRRKSVHGVRICPMCRKTWDRDVSAGINIFDIFYNSQVRGEARPWHLERNLQSRPAQAGTWFGNWVEIVDDSPADSIKFPAAWRTKSRNDETV